MYCVSGWLLVQVATQVLPIFEVSALILRLIVLAIIAGFPVALFLAWTFDFTRRGVIRTPDCDEIPALVHSAALRAPAPAAPVLISAHARAVLAEDEALLRGEMREMLTELWPELEVCEEAANGFEAIRALERHSPNVLFLDIRMPGLTGLEVAARASGRAHVVFVTAYDEYAIEAFDQGALDYVLKPVTPARLAKALERVRHRIGTTPANLGSLVERLRQAPDHADRPLQWISVQHEMDLRLITVDEICYLRSTEAGTTVVTADGEYPVSVSLDQLTAQLDPQLFWPIDAATLINANMIRSVHRDLLGRLEVTLRLRPETLSVSRAHAERFRNL